MNITKQLLTAGLFAIVGSGAFAQEATPDTWIKGSGSMSRAQVQSELAQARKDGTVSAVSAGYNFSGRTASVKLREQVRGEVAAARASGELAAMNAEAYAFDEPRTPVYAKAGSASAQ